MNFRFKRKSSQNTWAKNSSNGTKFPTKMKIHWQIPGFVKTKTAASKASQMEKTQTPQLQYCNTINIRSTLCQVLRADSSIRTTDGNKI